MAKALFGAAMLSVIAFAASPGSADPPDGFVTPHQHYIITADGDHVAVGPDSCSNGPSRQFDNFHNNVHFGKPGLHGVATGLPCPPP
jgi:hypothetical protein